MFDILKDQLGNSCYVEMFLFQAPRSFTGPQSPLGMMWALYGEQAIRLYAKRRIHGPRNTFDPINEKVLRDNPNASMRVSLSFEHGSNKYSLSRSISTGIPNPRDYRDLLPEELTLKKSRRK